MANKSTDREPPLGETTRAIISVLLFVHASIIFVCLSANLAPSPLQRRLLNVFRPYVQSLNFDLDGTRLYLTHAAIRDVDHRIEVLETAAAGDSQWESISRGVRGGERLHRYQSLADALAFFHEDDEITAIIAEGIARSYLNTDGHTIAQVRCRRHTLQSREAVASAVPAERNPDSPTYFGTVYRAEVLTPAAYQIRILKRSEASREAAPNRRDLGKAHSGDAEADPATAVAPSNQVP